MKKIILAPGTYQVKREDGQTVIEKLPDLSVLETPPEGVIIVVTDTFFQWTSVFD